MKVYSRRSVFTPSGVTARLLAWACLHAPLETQLPLAACYGITELLGLGRLFKEAITPMIKSVLRERLHAYSGFNAKEGSPTKTGTNQIP